MLKKYMISICILVVMIFLLMFDKYIFKMDIFGINISIYYMMILFIGIYLDTASGIIIVSILSVIQDITIGTNFGNIIISTIVSFLILKKVNKILYEEKLINTILKQIILYFSYNNTINYANILGISMKEIVFLTLIIIVAYPLLKEIGTYIGKEYKNKNIITKYF